MLYKENTCIVLLVNYLNLFSNMDPAGGGLISCRRWYLLEVVLSLDGTNDVGCVIAGWS